MKSPSKIEARKRALALAENLISRAVAEGLTPLEFVTKESARRGAEVSSNFKLPADASRGYTEGDDDQQG